MTNIASAADLRHGTGMLRVFYAVAPVDFDPNDGTFRATGDFVEVESLAEAVSLRDRSTGWHVIREVPASYRGSIRFSASTAGGWSNWSINDAVRRAIDARMAETDPHRRELEALGYATDTGFDGVLITRNGRASGPFLTMADAATFAKACEIRAADRAAAEG